MEYDMKCPQCAAEMRPGLAVVKMKSAVLPMLAGFGLNGYQHLWFVPTGAPDEQALRMAMVSADGELVLKAALPARAWDCRACRTTVIVGEGPAELS
jgi:hypothetical protein